MKSNLMTLVFLSFCFVSLQAQTLNQEITEEGQASFLLGKINKDGLLLESYNTWFTKNYEEYTIDAEVISHLKTALKGHTIKVFLGTWCGDSKREVPRFYKVIEEADFPENQLQVFALSGKAEMYKQSPDKDEAGLNIHRVPTFIVYKDGKEVNRIVEYPVDSFEKDLLAICTNQYYEPNYLIVEKVHEFIENETMATFTKIMPSLAAVLKPISKKNAELNTYARVLYSNNKIAEAIEIVKLNTLLFPEEFASYQWLGYYYYALDKKQEALNYYKKALELDVDNENIKNTINYIENEL